MNDNDPKYYRYLILFNEDVQDADPILHISDMNKLKAMNEGRMHLFDDALNAILPAVEYCFHMPRTELDTYDTDTEVWIRRMMFRRIYLLCRIVGSLQLI